MAARTRCDRNRIAGDTSIGWFGLICNRLGLWLEERIRPAMVSRETLLCGNRSCDIDRNRHQFFEYKTDASALLDSNYEWSSSATIASADHAHLQR